MAVRTQGSRPDYAGIMGSQTFSEGVHEWDLKLENEMYGIWVGVANGDFSRSLGSEESPNTIDPSSGHIWWFRSSGNYGQNFGHEGSSRRSHEAEYRMREGETFRLRLDCGEGRLELHIPKRGSGEFELVAFLKGIR